MTHPLYWCHSWQLNPSTPQMSCRNPLRNLTKRLWHGLQTPQIYWNCAGQKRSPSFHLTIPKEPLSVPGSWEEPLRGPSECILTGQSSLSGERETNILEVLLLWMKTRDIFMQEHASIRCSKKIASLKGTPYPSTGEMWAFQLQRSTLCSSCQQTSWQHFPPMSLPSLCLVVSTSENTLQKGLSMWIKAIAFKPNVKCSLTKVKWTPPTVLDLTKQDIQERLIRVTCSVP